MFFFVSYIFFFFVLRVFVPLLLAWSVSSSSRAKSPRGGGAFCVVLLPRHSTSSVQGKSNPAVKGVGAQGVRSTSPLLHFLPSLSRGNTSRSRQEDAQEKRRASNAHTRDETNRRDEQTRGHVRVTSGEKRRRSECFRKSTRALSTTHNRK